MSHCQARNAARPNDAARATPRSAARGNAGGATACKQSSANSAHSITPPRTILTTCASSADSHCQ